MAVKTTLSTTISRQSVIAIPKDFVRAAPRVGQCGVLASDLHQSCCNEIGTAATTLACESLAQGQSDGGGQTFAGQVGKLSRKPVGFVIPDA
jgi:hypothetical protein